ncbi:hypothetical protein SAMN05443633_101345 [Chryseobacterium arachidis]|uniref:Uncharacterized protein n=1 Tax=Chryseobacterium arachidis TaxID=1416778 RepID=A0A1M4TWU7_9FLAO|nr:hypothetical protein SAMN05443633_101345 [Chryseobacterium arachidis]
MMIFKNNPAVHAQASGTFGFKKHNFKQQLIELKNG